MKLQFCRRVGPGFWFLDQCFGVGVCVGCYSGSGFSSWTGGSCDFGSVKSFSPLVRLADCGLVLGLQLFYALTMLSMVV